MSLNGVGLKVSGESIPLTHASSNVGYKYAPTLKIHPRKYVCLLSYLFIIFSMGWRKVDREGGREREKEEGRGRERDGVGQ